MRDLAKRKKAAVIGMSEPKLYNTVLDEEIHTENYEILRFDRNQHGGSVACYIRSDISCKLNSFLYLDAIHKTNHNWNYLQTPQSV